MARAVDSVRFVPYNNEGRRSDGQRIRAIADEFIPCPYAKLYSSGFGSREDTATVAIGHSAKVSTARSRRGEIEAFASAAPRIKSSGEKPVCGIVDPNIGHA